MQPTKDHEAILDLVKGEGLSDAEKTLVELGFREIGSGSESYVFSNGEGYVVKLCHHAFDGDPKARFKRAEGKEDFAQGFAEPTYFGWLIIQEEVEEVTGSSDRDTELCEFCNEMEMKHAIGDHYCYGNCGFKNGRRVVIDWKDAL
jgi:hypothetical protein